MSKYSVYEGLKIAISRHALPHYGFEDSEVTLLFESWEQFAPFDSFLNTAPLPNDLKLCIYAEAVNGHSDGVAVTVSDEIQHLTYWQLYSNMRQKVKEFEEFISQVLKTGATIHGYDYESFEVEFEERQFNIFIKEFYWDEKRFFLGRNYSIMRFEPEMVTFGLSFDHVDEQVWEAVRNGGITSKK